MKSNILRFLSGMILGGILSVFVLLGVFAYKLRSNTINYYNYQLEKLDSSVVLIGDSYGVNYDSVVPNNNSWVGWADSFKLLFSDASVYTSAAGGSGFLGGVPQTFEIQLDKIIGIVENADEITEVVVLGGYNDVSTFRTETELDDAVFSFAQKAKHAFPNAGISFMYLSVDYVNQDMQKRINDYEQIFRRICQKNDVKYVDNASTILNERELIWWDEVDSNSGYHPSTEGGRKIAMKIAEYIVNGRIAEE